MDAKKIKKFIELYNLTKTVINNDVWVPTRTDKEIEDLISPDDERGEDWIGFDLNGSPKESLKASAEPNIYVTINKNAQITIGLAFDKVDSVKKLKNILTDIHNAERKDLLTKLSKLGPNWKTSVDEKVNDVYKDKPKYLPSEFTIKSNEINEAKIKEMFAECVRLFKKGADNRTKRKENKEKPSHGPNVNPSTKLPFRINPSIHLIETSFPQHPSNEEFKTNIRAAFEVLEICKKIKSESEMKKMLKDDVKELKELEKEVPSLTRAKRIWDSQKSIGKISTEQYDGALSNLETKKKRLEELQEKQKSL